MKEQKRYIVWLPLIFGAVAAIGLVTGYELAGTGVKWQTQESNQRSSIQEVIDLLKIKYVDSLAIDSLQQKGITAILQQLDPHTVYIPAQDLDDVNADLAGGFFGIGVEYQMINDTMNLVYVMENGPADKAGLQTADQVIAVNGENVAGVKISGTELRKKIRGSKNSMVDLTALRNRSNKVEARITRGNIPLPSVDAAQIVTDSIGYIKLNKFSETSYKEFMDAATGLQKKGMKQLIIDLRGNGGGILNEATNIADELIDDGKKLVTTKGNSLKEKVITSTKPGILEASDVVVLIDDYSASASEVLAGALQDHDRATIIGRRSFGKGLVQEQYTLSDGSALRLTVARYYTPSGRSIQKPYDEGTEAYRSEVYHRNSTSDSAMFAKQPAFKTGNGKVVYGGGGITPDIAVERDTATVFMRQRMLFEPELISRFAFSLFKRDQAKIRNYKSAEEFASAYNLTSNDWNLFVAEAKADSINVAAVDAGYKPELELRIKANMARFIWRNQGFYTIMRPKDNYLKTAISFLQGNKAGK